MTAPSSPEELRRSIVDLQSGRFATVGEFSLAVTPATTTVVTARLCSTVSAVLVTPKDAGAATEVGAGGMFIVPAKGTFTVTHSASASTRTFRYAIFTNIHRID